MISLAPIYDFLKQRGATEEREHLWLAGTWVQLIPTFDALTKEAVCEAVEKTSDSRARRLSARRGRSGYIRRPAGTGERDWMVVGRASFKDVPKAV